MQTVLGIAGRIGSGKSTISKELAERLHWKRVGFGDYVRSIAEVRGVPFNRRSLQELGALLVQDECIEFCEGLLSTANWQPNKPLVIDGIRHSEVLSTLKDLVKPSTFSLVYLKVDEDTLKKRYETSKNSSFDELLELEEHSTETEVIESLQDQADFYVDGSGSISEVVQSIIEWLKQNPK